MRKIASHLIVLALAAAPAAARVKVTISPSSPIVDEAITVKWKTDRTLKPNYHYQVTVVVASGGREGCASIVTKDSRRRPRKGESMRMNFSSTDDGPNRSPAEWCRGKAYARVSIVSNAGWFENIVGSTEFRFSGKP